MCCSSKARAESGGKQQVKETARGCALRCSEALPRAPGPWTRQQTPVCALAGGQTRTPRAVSSLPWRSVVSTAGIQAPAPTSPSLPSCSYHTCGPAQPPTAVLGPDKSRAEEEG